MDYPSERIQWLETVSPDDYDLITEKDKVYMQSVLDERWDSEITKIGNEYLRWHSDELSFQRKIRELDKTLIRYKGLLIINPIGQKAKSGIYTPFDYVNMGLVSHITSGGLEYAWFYTKMFDKPRPTFADDIYMLDTILNRRLYPSSDEQMTEVEYRGVCYRARVVEYHFKQELAYEHSYIWHRLTDSEFVTLYAVLEVLAPLYENYKQERVASLEEYDVENHVSHLTTRKWNGEPVFREIDGEDKYARSIRIKEYKNKVVVPWFRFMDGCHPESGECMSEEKAISSMMYGRLIPVDSVGNDTYINKNNQAVSKNGRINQFSCVIGIVDTVLFSTFCFMALNYEMLSWLFGPLLIAIVLFNIAATHIMRKIRENEPDSLSPRAIINLCVVGIILFIAVYGLDDCLDLGAALLVITIVGNIIYDIATLPPKK